MSDETEVRRRAYFVGVLLVFAAAVLWSLNGALIKVIHEGGEGPHAVTMAFYRSLIAGVVLLPLARGKLHTLGRRRGRRTPGTESGNRSRNTSQGKARDAHRSPLAIRHSLFAICQTLLALRPAAISCVVFFTLMTVCFVVANTKTEAANVIVLQYTSTFWVFGLSPWLLRERAGVEELWILGLAMIGIVIIFVGNTTTDLMGLVVALASGLFYALLTLMIRQMRDSDSGAVTVVNNLGSALLLLPLVLLFGSLSVSPRAGVLLAVMGAVQFGLPYYLYARGLARVVAYQVALITLAEVVLNPVWTYLIVGEAAPRATMIGGSVILVALILFVRVARKRGQQLGREQVS
jgi:drug/metabolite transporter (DMT)-like permease